MKRKAFQITAILVIALLSVTSVTSGKEKDRKEKVQGAKAGTVKLFNGKNLNNWSFFLRDASVDPAKVFTVKDGVIHITGDPFGYMRTKEVYSDYLLHVEWRYPTEATNSGIFVHTQAADTIWPKCIECQLKAGSAGDFVCMNGADINERTNKASRSVVKKNDSNEKPVGEWNTMEVTCRANTIDVVVNGLLQNRATGVNISEGSICIQSEGKAIEFRNVYLTKLKK